MENFGSDIPILIRQPLNEVQGKLNKKKRPVVVNPGQIITLEVTGINSNGEGVASVDGFKIFVEQGLPGEILKAKIIQVKKNYGKAIILDFQCASANRVEPQCAYYPTCGGCQLMHLAYSQQLVMKTNRVNEAFDRIFKGTFTEVRPCLASPTEWFYRNKIQLPLAIKGGQVCLGLYKKRTHDLVPIENCLIQSENGNLVLKAVQEIIRLSGMSVYNEKNGKGAFRHVLLKTATTGNQVLVILVLNDKRMHPYLPIAKKIIEQLSAVVGVVQNVNCQASNVVLGSVYKTLAGQAFLDERVFDLIIRRSSASFFQVNHGQMLQLYQRIQQVADLKPSDILWDLYCGIGTLTLFLAAFVREAIGIEIVPEAIQDAILNAKLNTIKNIRFVCGAVENLVKTLKLPTVVVLDPPRKGCDAKLIAVLREIKPDRIIYVSCDPATLARDLAALGDDCFTIKQILPFDMFPQTCHVETIVKLQCIETK